MTRRLRFLSSFFFPLFIYGFAASPAAAQTSDNRAPAVHDESGHGVHLNNLIQGQHVEGHIAFLHAELHITPAQEALWAPVAAAMHDDVKVMSDAETSAAGKTGPETAITYLENRVAFADLRAKGEVRFLNVFRPLYESLSSSQKKAADELLMPHEPD